MSDTPRTDEQTRFVGEYHGDRVPANFARNLERENAELLEALEGVVALSDRKHDAWDKAHAAIAKARNA